jgi:outer membrane protein TolC
MKRLILALLCAVPVFAQTVDQTVAIALKNNANIQNAQLEIEKAEERVSAAKTKRLPKFELQAIGGEALTNLSIEIDNGSAGAPNGEKTRVDLARTFNTIAVARITQPLTQLHSIRLGVQLNETAVKANKEQERAARLAITREVKSAYYAVLSARGYANAMKEAVTAAEEVDREMNVRVSQKAALEADHLDASARLAATKVAALSANNALASAQDRLNYLVGAEVEVSDAAFEEMPKLTGATDEVIAQRPDVREAAVRVEQSKLDMQLKNTERIPEVALMVSSATPIGNDVLPSNMTSVGISMSYEPFTWGRRSAELREKRHAVAQAENALRDKQALASVEIAAYGRKVEEAAAQIAVRKFESEAARERLRVTKARFQVLAARPEEMFNAGASLTQAAAREQEAISAYWTARADYEKAIGEE